MMGDRRWSGWRGVATLATVSIGLAVPVATASGASYAPGGPERQALNLPAAVSSAPPAVQAARERLRDGHARGVASPDPRTGALRVLANVGGFLTGASADTPAKVALGYVSDHQRAFGLSDADIAGLRLVRRYTSSPDGVTHLLWQQISGGVPSVDSDLRANVAADGRLINVLGSPRSLPALTHPTPATSARGAYASVLRSVGSNRSVPAIRAQSGAARRTDFAGTGQGQLVLYSAPGGERLAWRMLVPTGRNADYDALVDARTGRVVAQANLVRFASALVHENYPGAPAGGRQVVRPIDPWLFPGEQRLNGNNAHAFLDVDDVVGYRLLTDRIEDNFTPPASGDVPPSGDRDWLYAIQSVPDPTGLCPDAAPGCTWNHTAPFSWRTNERQATTQLFYFVNRYHDHLLAPPIGFDEASGNFQVTNPSGEGKGGDPVLAQADDGADTGGNGLPDDDHVDNANFDTRPDGIPGRMQMYLFEPLGLEGGLDFRSVNGSDDAEIVYHEYTHGLSNRLITDSMGFGALDNQQASAMGEAWGDWYGMDFLAQQGLVTDTAQPGELNEGSYVQTGSLIRTEPFDCPVGTTSPACPGSGEAGPGGYTYGDFGRILADPANGGVPEPHADGEIWTQTLWQLRQALVAAHGQLDGSRRAERLVTGGMRLSPPEPTFLDMRNAILQEDSVAGGGDQALIWRVFADRGMGWSASTTGAGDVDPIEDFSVPPAANAAEGTLRGVVRDDRGRPVAGVLVGLSGHDTPGVGPVLQDTTGPDGSYEIRAPRGTYPALVVRAPAGYSDQTTEAVTLGADQRRDLTVRRNFADVNTRARIVSFTGRDETAVGCGPAKAVDGNRGTGLDTAAPGADDPATPQDETVAAPQLTVRLSQRIANAQVLIDPTAHCYNLPGASLGAYRIELSRDGTTWTPVAEGRFDRRDLYRLDPVALRDVPARVRYVRLTALSTQGVPGTLYDDFGFLSFAELQVAGVRR